MEDTRLHALDYVSMFQRRKWWLLLPIAASIVVGAALVRFLPKEYRAATTLGVTAPMVSPSLVNQAASLDNQERLRAISQQMLSLPVLERVVKEEGMGRGGPADPAIVKIRRSVEISVPEPVANVTEPRRLDTFVVAYSDEQPARAQRIANRLAAVFVDANSETRTERAEDTSAFIATQLRTSQGRLADIEQRLRKAKEAHMGRLPEQTQANLQNLTGLRQQLEATATTLRGEQDRLSMIERQIESLRQGRQEMPLPTRAGSDAAQPPESRVVTLERELAAARVMYTEKHPEIQRLQEEVARARKEAAADRQRPEQDRLASDPSYRQLAADREMARLRIREIERSSADIQRQITLYQARVEAAPMVEQQLAALERDYALEKQQYADLSSKLHAAAIAENVERNRGGEQFMVLYPAPMPLQPTRPVPIRVMLLSILGGVALGAALALGREYLDRSVHDLRELKDELDLPVLGEIARIQPI